MSTTFHIAASPGVERVRDLTDFLLSKKWRWSNSHDALTRPLILDKAWSVQDMRAALTADVFIMVLGLEVPPDVHAKYGARWATHRSIHGVRLDDTVGKLMDLPGVIWFDSIDDYAQATFGA
jgi:hypothetical protein